MPLVNYETTLQHVLCLIIFGNIEKKAIGKSHIRYSRRKFCCTQFFRSFLNGAKMNGAYIS